MGEQELDKKLAEWVGFHKFRCVKEPLFNVEIVPYPDLTQSLDSCFKWLVSEVLKIITKKGYIPPIMKLFQMWYDELVNLSGNSSNVQQAAFALCLAVEKLIDSERKVT